MKVRRLDYYPDEYIVGVSRMTFEHQGVYWMICSLIMSHGGPIENDPKWIGKLGSMGVARCRNIISDLIAHGKLVENCGKIGQKRAESELKYAQKRIETAHKNGSKGGRPPSENNDLAEPGGFSDEKLTTNYQLPTTNLIAPDSDPPDGEMLNGHHHKKPADRFPAKSKLPTRGSGLEYPDEFEAAWSAYPVRPEDGKAGCYEHWRSWVVSKRVPPEVIIEGARAYARAKAGDEMRIGFRRWCREGLWMQQGLVTGERATAPPKRKRPNIMDPDFDPYDYGYGGLPDA